MSAYPGTVYRSQHAEARVFTVAFIVLIAALFALAAVAMAATILAPFPIVPAAIGGGLIGLGTGLACRAIENLG